MPLHSVIQNDDYTIGLWHITEDIDFFSPWFDHPQIHHEKKKLQWYATRHLTNLLMNEEVEVLNDESGRPFIKGIDTCISISHTPQFAAVMLSKQKQVGIDLETIHPKVQRVAHKFLRDDERFRISENELTEKLIVYWSAKEALYKLHGRKRLDFKSQLLIQPFELHKFGRLQANIATNEVNWGELEVHYSFIDNHVLTYVAI